MEKERRDAEKAAEEERKRREKLNNVTDGVSEESVVTLGGPIQYENIEAPVEKQYQQGGGEIDTSSVAKETDYEAQMRMEEERLLHKTKNTAPFPPPKQEPKRVEPVGYGKKVKVTLIDRNTEKPLQTHDWYCTENRLPLKAIMHEWKITNVVWADVGQPIGVHPDGYSDMTFEGISHLKIFADRAY